jgi:hypothetical protein
VPVIRWAPAHQATYRGSGTLRGVRTQRPRDIHRPRLVASRRQARLTGNAVPPAGTKSALALYSNGAVSLQLG